jgi:DNA polymerase-3 subunit delta'
VRTAFRAKGNKAVVLELSEWSQSLASKGIETQKQFLSFAIQMFRAALMNHYKLEAVANFYPKSDFKLERFAAFIHGANILPIITALEDSMYHLSRNGSPQMIFTELSFKLTRLLHTKA